MTTPDSPFGNLHGAFGQGATTTGMNYTHAQEEKFRQMMQEKLSQTETGKALLQFASQQRIVVRIVKGKNSSGYVPDSRAIFIAVPADLSTVPLDTILGLAAYLRQAQLQFLGYKNPNESMASLDKAVAFDSKMLDSIITMCKIASEQYEIGHAEFVDTLLKMGHGELYESLKEQGTGPHLVDLFYKIYIKTG